MRKKHIIQIIKLELEFFKAHYGVTFLETFPQQFYDAQDYRKNPSINYVYLQLWADKKNPKYPWNVINLSRIYLLFNFTCWPYLWISRHPLILGLHPLDTAIQFGLHNFTMYKLIYVEFYLLKRYFFNLYIYFHLKIFLTFWTSKNHSQWALINLKLLALSILWKFGINHLPLT